MSNNEEQDSGSVSDETEEFTDAVADKLLGEITPVTEEVLAGFTEQDHFSHLAFDLYKETGILLSVCAHLCTEEEANAAVIERNHAICAGLLIRISKFTVAVTQLLATAERGKVVMALHRSVMESAINLRFLLFKNDNEVYQQFVQSSLAPERELVDRIQENIGKREKHEIWPIENRMLDSIQSTCRLSGVRIEDIGPRRGQWAGGMKERLKALGEEELYLFAERLPSHAVHGTWVDLLLHHLEPKNWRFHARSVVVTYRPTAGMPRLPANFAGAVSLPRNVLSSRAGNSRNLRQDGGPLAANSSSGSGSRGVDEQSRNGKLNQIGAKRKLHGHRNRRLRTRNGPV